MKQNILYFTLGVVFTVSVGAAGTNLYEVKPAKPTHVIIKSIGDAGLGNQEDTDKKAELFINKKIAEGYVLSSSESISPVSVRVVMTKY